MSQQSNEDSTSRKSASAESTLAPDPASSVDFTALSNSIADTYLRNGTIIESCSTKRRYEIMDTISKSHSAIILKLQERNAPVFQKCKNFVMKVECGPEPQGAEGLKAELHVLARATEARRLRPNLVDSFVDLLDRGVTDEFRFLVVSTLSDNLLDLQKSCGAFPMSTAVRINKRTFNAVRNLHLLGFVHRNIQPSNFAVGSSSMNTIVFLLGFTLSRPIDLDVLGNELPPSQKIGQSIPPTLQRPNTLVAKYMPRRGHIGLRDLTRLDDVESWLFMCLEMCSPGCLPWTKCVMPSEMLLLKQDFFLHQHDFELFHERLPMEYRRIIDIVNSIVFRAAPDYIKICDVNDKLCKLFPSKRKTASPAMDGTKSLMLATTTISTPSVMDATHSFYGTLSSNVVFPLKGKPKDKTSAKDKNSVQRTKRQSKNKNSNASPKKVGNKTKSPKKGKDREKGQPKTDPGRKTPPKTPGSTASTPKQVPTPSPPPPGPPTPTAGNPPTPNSQPVLSKSRKVGNAFKSVMSAVMPPKSNEKQPK
uniref:Protein kinase domain-containing protein n=1 Tax=Panagrellus redivivus TaxID=6233 RepID=A0A7E4UPC2_PANRE